MNLRIRKLKQFKNDRPVFVVRCELLKLADSEQMRLLNYGAPHLTKVFDDSEAVAKLYMGNIDRPFPDVHAALEFIKQVKEACAATEADWRLADAFEGNDDYPDGWLRFDRSNSRVTRS